MTLSILITGIVLATLLILPTWPALQELLRRRDASPLPLADEYHADLHLQAERFGREARGALNAAMQAYRLGGARKGGARKALDPSYDVSGPHSAGEEALEHGEKPLLMIRPSGVTWSDGIRVRRSTYVAGNLETGDGGRFVRLFVDGDARLGQESTINEWVHASGSLTIGCGAVACGSLRAARMQVGPGSHFERLEAKEIFFGDDWHLEGESGNQPLTESSTMPVFRLLGQSSSLGDARRKEGNLIIPGGHRWEGNLVVTGNLHVGRKAVVTGDIKVHGSATADQGSLIDGHLVAEGGIDLRSGARVLGTVATEGSLRIRSLVEIGTPTGPASVHGRSLLVDQGVRVFGTVVALEHGRVATRTAVRRAA
jgi:cytoskeletal protein CcmA (bactofilin family)